jgi:hypothetical protein
MGCCALLMLSLLLLLLPSALLPAMQERLLHCFLTPFQEPAHTENSVTCNLSRVSKRALTSWHQQFRMAAVWTR